MRLQLQVRRGKADAPPACVAVNDFTVKAVSASQQASRLFQIRRSQLAPNARGTDRLALHLQRFQKLHLEAEALRERTHVHGGSIAATAESVIVAHEQVAHPQTLQQDLLHEIGGGHSGKRAVEIQLNDVIQAEASQQLQSLSSIAKQINTRGLYHAARMWPEGDHDRRKSQLARVCANPLQQVAMADVHAIEGADGKDAAGKGSRHRQAVDLISHGLSLSARGLRSTAPG